MPGVRSVILMFFRLFVDFRGAQGMVKCDDFKSLADTSVSSLAEPEADLGSGQAGRRPLPQSGIVRHRVPILSVVSGLRPSHFVATSIPGLLAGSSTRAGLWQPFGPGLTHPSRTVTASS